MMGVLERARARLAEVFVSSEMPTPGASSQATDGGRGLRFPLMKKPMSAASLAVADEALARIANTPWVAMKEREAHRWADVVVLAWSGVGNGCLAHSIASLRSIDEWIAQDRFGEGEAWRHSSDVAWRLMRASFVLSLLDEEVDPGLLRRIAGSADHHGRFLNRAVLTTDSAFYRRRILQSSALIVAGLTWPKLGGARAWWSESLVRIASDLPRILAPDGSPSIPLGEFVESVEAAAMAKSACKRMGIAFPERADGALLQAIVFLRSMAGDACFLEHNGFSSLWSTDQQQGLVALWNLLVDWGLVDSDSTSEASRDPVGQVLVGAPLEDGRGVGVSNSWSLAAYRSTGWISAHGGNRDGEIYCFWGAGALGGVQQVAWGAIGLPVLTLPHPLSGWGVGNDNADVQNARVDDRTLQLHAHFSSGALQRHRKLIATGQRLIVQDRLIGKKGGEVSLTWRLADGWVFSKSGDLSKANYGERALVLSLPEELKWGLTQDGDGVILSGRGWLAPDQRVQTSFEFR